MAGRPTRSQWYGGPPDRPGDDQDGARRTNGGACRNRPDTLRRRLGADLRTGGTGAGWCGRRDVDDPMGSSTVDPTRASMRAMRIIAEAPRLTRSDRVKLVRGAFVSALLIFVGALIGWAIVATPVFGSLMPGFRPSMLQIATGVLAFAFAILVPAGMMILGVARAVATLELLGILRPSAQAPKLVGRLDDRHYVATALRLPDGRYIHELVLGPFGIAVLGDVPPPDISRVVGGRWELRHGRKGWKPVESPLDRTSRDAERIRRWMGGEDQDFVVKVYAVVVTADPRVERTSTCLVVPPAQVAEWLEGLPPQRGLTQGRHAELVELIRSVAPIGR